MYGRLVTAIEARRAYLQPPLQQEQPDAEIVTPPPAEQDDELLDEPAEGDPGMQPLGDLLDGAPDVVLAHLREST